MHYFDKGLILTSPSAQICRNPNFPGIMHYLDKGLILTSPSAQICRNPNFPGIMHYLDTGLILNSPSAQICRNPTCSTASCMLCPGVLKSGNNGWVSCSTYCQGSQWGFPYATCVGAYDSAANQPVPYDCNKSRQIMTQDLTCYCMGWAPGKCCYQGFLNPKHKTSCLVSQDTLPSGIFVCYCEVPIRGLLMIVFARV